MRDLPAFAAFIAAREAMPFIWGSNDCGTFAFGAIEALTGVNRLVGIPPWNSELTALLTMRRRGGLIATVSTLLREIPASHAHRGDVAAVMTVDGPFLMVIEGITLVGPSITGLMRHRRDALVKAWSAEA
jgi:hypothetical protein